MNGDRYSTMAGRIKQSVDGSYKKAIRISRTETHRVREAGNLDAAIGTRSVIFWECPVADDEGLENHERRAGPASEAEGQE